MFSLSRRPLSRATSFACCRKAQLNSKSAEIHAAALALFLNGATSTPSTTQSCGLIPALRFPLEAKIAFNKAFLLILIELPSPVSSQPPNAFSVDPWQRPTQTRRKGRCFERVHFYNH